MKYSILILSFLISCSCLSFAEMRTVDLVFEIQDDQESTVTVDLNPGSSDSKKVSYSGTMNARVVFDEETLRPINFRFTGGRVHATDADFSFSGAINYIGFGTFFTTFRMRTFDVSSVFETIGAGTVNADGSIVPSEHQVLIDQGINRLDFTISGIGSDTEIVDLASENEVSILEGAGRISISVQSSTDLEQTLLFTLVSETDVTTSEPLEDTNATLVTREVGTTTSFATATIPTSYGQWLIDNGIDSVDADSANAAGVAYRLLHAFDLDSSSSSIPFELRKESEGLPLVELSLPANGLNASLKAEYRTDLSSGAWSDLPASNHLDGVGSLSSGESGRIQLSFPNGERGFIRLVTAQ